MAVTVKYNGVKLTDLFIVGEQKRPLPEFRVSTTAIEGVDGESFDGMTIGLRECSFTVTAISKTKRGLQDAARVLASALSVREPKRLVFSDEKDPDKNQLFRLALPTDSFDSREFIRAAQWTCRFVQPDPYLYGKERSIVLRSHTPKQVDTGGNTYAWPTAVATFKSKGGNSSEYEFWVNNDKVVFRAPWAKGAKLTVNAKNQLVRLSPAASGAKGLQTGSRFAPMEGRVTLYATAPTTVTWRERWL